jgi:hypothetical protein
MVFPCYDPIIIIGRGTRNAFFGITSLFLLYITLANLSESCFLFIFFSS